MRLPTATYRLQFREGVDFDRATDLVPYFAGLGVSHLYASPLFTATTGSTHGYDVTDPTTIDPVLGGRSGLERLSRALKAEGLGLVLDIVPNHMAFSPETPWLRDVLRRGSGSPFAHHFDVDPDAGPLRLPWLPAPFAQLVQEGALAVEEDPDGPVLVTGGLRIPLSATPSLDAARTDPEAIPALHDEQPWQAVHWRTEMDLISHRRFFNITGLIGVRVEDEEVFEDAHALLFDLIDAGIVDGVRIDHVDGLADPGGYLDRLRKRLPNTPLWVEKILTGPEPLPESWPIEGTTGYEIARSLNRLMTSAPGLDRMTRDFREVTGRTEPFETVMNASKRQIVTQELSAELWSLHAMLTDIAAQDPEAAELGPEALREALIAFIAAFPRYRTYMTEDDIPDADAAIIRDTIEQADNGLLAEAALQALGNALVAPGPEAARLRIRMQQVTGAAAAKAQEDTAFFREPRLLSMNEVGGEPNDSALSPDDFHRLMRDRAGSMPMGLTLTSSHDTKRSEDARMRIAALSHRPEGFAAWFGAARAEAPEDMDPTLIWYLAQSRVALGDDAPDAADRLADHVVKAMREAKMVTFHTAPDEEAEAAAQDFGRRLAARPLAGFGPLDGLDAAAAHLSLVQSALKLTIPGIPDVYQGTETEALALTDPDNRRPVDFPLLNRALHDPQALAEGLPRDKFALTRALLHLRRDHPRLMDTGGYTPLPSGPRGLVFARQAEGKRLEVSVALSPGALAETEALSPGGRVVWPPEGAAPGPVAIRLHEGG